MAPLSQYSDFALSPEKYDGSIIKIHAQIVHVLENTTKEFLIRKAVDLYRTITKDDNRKGRYIHQRFIIKSPALLEEETIIVYHNTKFGEINLNPNDWLEIKGQYIHRESDSRKNRKYGLIHYTHEPKGYIKVLKGIPRQEIVSKVILS